LIPNPPCHRLGFPSATRLAALMALVAGLVPAARAQEAAEALSCGVLPA
jgi:hypothetical protein